MRNFYKSHIYSGVVQLIIIAGLIIGSKYNYLPVSVNAKPATHINFIEDAFDEALRQGAKQNKYIFVDAYATWCGPCKMLKARTFTDSQAAAFFNSNFVNVSVDMEKGQGPQLARKWGLRVYPTLIIFDPKGNAVLGAEGFISANDLIRFGKQALAKK